MSRTRRKLPAWANDPSLTKSVERGLVSIPKREGLKGGRTGSYETWGQAGKKFRKQLLARHARREGKRVSKESTDT